MSEVARVLSIQELDSAGGGGFFTFQSVDTQLLTTTPVLDQGSAEPASGLMCQCPACGGRQVEDGDGGEPQYFSDGGYDRGGTAPNGKNSLTITAAGEQITRGNYTWGVRIGEAAEVTYAFRANEPIMPTDTSGFSRFNATQIAVTELALRSWSDVANVTFTRVNSGAAGAENYSDNASMLFGNYSSGQNGAAAFAYYPGSPATASVSGDVWVNSSFSYNSNPVLKGYGFQVLTHEIGHAIGLAHPGAYNASEGNPLSYRNNAEYYEDSRQYSVMSYFNARETGANHSNQYSSAPLLDDIAAAQRLYGANMTTRLGDTVYGFNSNADRPWYAATATSAPIFAIWDAGGNDTLDFSGYGMTQTIDLRGGAFSSVGGYTYNVSIAQNVGIENAKGGSGSDTITGNDLNNLIWGGLGGDVIFAGGGADTVYGGSATFDSAFNDGGDFILGGSGNDVLYGEGGVDLLGGEDGNDTLYGGLGGDNMYGGAGDDLLIGDWGDDFMSGQDGDDVLIGGAGSDVLNGGAGRDKFVYFTGDSVLGAADRIEGFQSGVDKIDLSLMDADATIAGKQDFTYAGLTNDPTGAGTVRLGFIEGVGIFLFGYTDGDGVADFLVDIGTFNINVADLILRLPVVAGAPAEFQEIASPVHGADGWML